MTRKKSERISLRKPSGKAYRQVLVSSEDHGKLPSLAARIKAAHPDTEVSKVADVLHFALNCAELILANKGA